MATDMKNNAHPERDDAAPEDLQVSGENQLLKKPAAEDPLAQYEPAAEKAAPKEPVAANPAKKIGAVFLLLLIVIVAWYAVTDRTAPYTGRASVSAYVAQIAPRVAGQVTEVFVEDNTIVDAGDPLFQLDRRAFELAVRQAEANLAQAMQATDVSAAGVASAQARVSQSRANLENVRASASRTNSLAERGIVSQAQVDTAEAELLTAEAQLEAAESDLRSAVAQLGGDNGEPAPNILAAQLQLEEAQLNLLYSTVTAPTLGVVTNLQLAIGQYAAAGTPGMTFIDSRGGWITADLRENQLGLVAPGDEVGILFDVMPGRIYTGRVHSVAWGIDPGRTMAGGLMQNLPENRWFEPARRMPVRIELDGGMEAWPRQARAGAKVSVVVYSGGTSNPIAWIAAGLHRAQSYLSYLY